MKKVLILSLLNCYAFSQEVRNLYPIQFSIPEVKCVQTIPAKDRDFAFIVAGELDTYIYSEEQDYYKDYQRSYFAITKCKGGWDCMRHYEILANGCIPYFVDIDKCPEDIMVLLPKDLIKEAMSLEGVSYKKIDHKKFNKTKYYELLNKMLEHTHNHLTTKKMAQHVLDTVAYAGTGKILFLSQEVSPDYLRECVLIGLKELLHERVIDFPKIDFLYKSYDGDIKKLYGKGFSYSKILDDIPVDRDGIEQRIKNHEFDLIVYGSVHRGLLFHDVVCECYSPDSIIYVCGEDTHECEYVDQVPNLFLRELVK